MKILRVNIGLKKYYPKSISKPKVGKGFNVVFWSKKNKETINVGYFKSLDLAIWIRDEFIKNNINGILLGYLPRGITLQKARGFYTSKINFETNEFYVGHFKTVPEAVEARLKYIDSLLDHSDENHLSLMLPKGIENKKDGYVAKLEFEKDKFNLGFFNTIDEAVQFRTDYIISLK